MIERFYLKNFLGFDEVELDLKCGLIVFSGPSGSGKSMLMDSILSSFGVLSCDANICESSVTWDLSQNTSSIENDDINVFKHIKKEKSRYFINNQSLSKKAISEVASRHLKHLSLRDFSDFENENLLSVIDSRIQNKTEDIYAIKAKYKKLFDELQDVESELLRVTQEEKKIVELKEFAAFEIKKIEDINPLEGEDEELLKIKKELSKKEKVLQSIESANAIFSYEYNVSKALENIGIDGSFFDDAMNELRAVLDDAQDRFSALDDVDVEEILNRIEELAGLKRRYGSIQEALSYKEEKKLQLAEYENIEIKKDKLQSRYEKLTEDVKRLADTLSKLRHAEVESFCKDLNGYLGELYLRDAQVLIEDTSYLSSGKDMVLLKLNGVELQKISTGEFNRLRLAILALKSEFMSGNGGILMLDEIDANLSGEESMSVARVLKKLSKHFQIFVISHQPQLTSMGDQHFLVYKENDNSFVKELDFQSRVDEIARIISGKDISQEAKKFAKELLEAKNDDN
jgi:DNA repair protein RecN (Recombination protein N)